MAKFDYQNYGINSAEWQRIRNEIVFSRAENRCEACGVENGNYHIWQGYYSVSAGVMRQSLLTQTNKVKNLYIAQLHLAHINNDKKDMRYENLLSLCACCHRLFDSTKNDRESWKLNMMDGLFYFNMNQITLLTDDADIDNPVIVILSI